MICVLLGVMEDYMVGGFKAYYQHFAALGYLDTLDDSRS